MPQLTLSPFRSQAELRAAAAAAEAERDAQGAQARKLLSDSAKLQEQLNSATEDIFTLQVGPWLLRRPQVQAAPGGDAPAFLQLFVCARTCTFHTNADAT